MRTKLTKSVVGATFLGLLAQPTAAHEGTGTCKYHKHEWEETVCSTNALKVVYTVFGLFGSTQSYKLVKKKKTCYVYEGPPIPMPATRPVSGYGPEESVTLPGPAAGRTVGSGLVGSGTVGFNNYELRILDAETPCYGGTVVPDFDSEVQSIRFIGLDGQWQNLTVTPVTGTLAWFLGPNFDSTGFDPAWVSSSAWKGSKVTIQQSMLVQPSLIFTAGGNPDVPVTSVMNLDNPDQKVLSVDLGPDAGGTELIVLVSAKAPTDGALLVVDGITVPIVPDTYTSAFLNAYPNIGGTADANGHASIDFPPLSVGALEGVDLNVAVLAVDGTTGQAQEASTFVQVQLRDFDVCQ